jgi:hypothetical protein
VIRQLSGSFVRDLGKALSIREDLRSAGRVNGDSDSVTTVTRLRYRMRSTRAAARNRSPSAVKSRRRSIGGSIAGLPLREDREGMASGCRTRQWTSHMSEPASIRQRARMRAPRPEKKPDDSLRGTPNIVPVLRGFLRGSTICSASSNQTELDQFDIHGFKRE